MTRLTIEGTKSSPRIDFDPDTGRLAISGESYPENCQRFYGPVLAWLEEYLKEHRPKGLTLDMEIGYFNSSTSKTLMDLFDLLDQEASRGRAVEVNWRYQAQNEMAQECGEEFMQDLHGLRFNLVPL